MAELIGSYPEDNLNHDFNFRHIFNHRPTVPGGDPADCVEDYAFRYFPPSLKGDNFIFRHIINHIPPGVATRCQPGIGGDWIDPSDPFSFWVDPTGAHWTSP